MPQQTCSIIKDIPHTYPNQTNEQGQCVLTNIAVSRYSYIEPDQTHYGTDQMRWPCRLQMQHFYY